MLARHGRWRGSELPSLSFAIFGIVLGAVSLARGQGYVVWESSSSSAATALARLGDLDGDGAEDLVAGSPFASAGGLSWAGEVKVFSGATGTVLWNLAGTAQGERLGSSVAGVGAWDGDGLPDFAVGTPHASPGGLLDAGRVTVFSGANLAVLLELTGAAPGDSFGFSLARAYGVAGSAGLVVGAPGVDFGGLANNGEVKVVFPGGTAFTAHGFNSDDGLGYSAAAVDSSSVAAGAPQFSVCGGGPGYVLWLASPSGWILSVLTGNSSIIQDYFGVSVAGPGDLNGDGIGDLVAAHYQAWLCCSDCCGKPSSVQTFSGASGLAIGTFTTSPALQQVSIAGAADIDRDGLGDLVIRDWEYCCPAAFCPGGASLPVLRVVSGLSGQLIFTFPSSSGVGIGDVNGDNVPDVAVGSPPGVVSHFGIPPGSSTFGSGCPGSGG
jgi:hypothetical protein